MIVKLSISIKMNIQVMQTTSNSLWSYGVLPYLWKKNGAGQLKV